MQEKKKSAYIWLLLIGWKRKSAFAQLELLGASNLLYIEADIHTFKLTPWHRISHSWPPTFAYENFIPL